MNKYVIHLHQADTDHYDIMIERKETLITWQVQPADMKILLAGSPARAQQIQDHRKKYLIYEGPISCNRGMVTLYDTGVYQENQWDSDEMELILNGSKLKGAMRIKHVSGKTFSIQYQKKIDKE